VIKLSGDKVFQPTRKNKITRKTLSRNIQSKNSTIKSYSNPQRPSIVPGMLLTLAITGFACTIHFLEFYYFEFIAIEALVIALLIGIAWRNCFGVSPCYIPGIRFAGKQMLEIAIVFLGASLDLALVTKAGQSLVIAVVMTVIFGLVISFTIGRLAGLNRRLAALIAVGNSICGNSAIAVVAPVISAKPNEIASAISLTAIIGVIIVLGMPKLIGVLNLGLYQYGVLAGLTVYAVPQVMAATFPLGVLSVKVGTLVKLLRVLMLGPVVLMLSFLGRNKEATKGTRWYSAVPWFIIGFGLMAYLRSKNMVPDGIADELRQLSLMMTVAAMTALGLETNFQSVRQVGVRVIFTVVLSLMFLIAISIGMIQLLNIR